MALSNTERQRAFRQRHKDRVERQTAALHQIEALISRNTKPWADNVRRIIRDALAL